LAQGSILTTSVGSLFLLHFAAMGQCKSSGPLPTQAAWDNHFSAFGTQDVEKILIDYSEDSVITTFDQTTGTKTEYKGLAGARECFVGLFKSLSDLKDLAAPVQVVKEATADAPGSVFLVWKCPASGYTQATDTFIFDASSKILRQNVVFVYQDPKGDGNVVAKNDTEEASGSGPVHDGWSNHFAAFGAQDVEKILADYVESSEITVFNHVDGTKTEYQGLTGARNCFVGLFKSLFDTSNLGAPIVHVEETAAGGQVLLVWNAAASGYVRATDTFIFNSAGKILRQHVVVHYEAPAAPAAPGAPAASAAPAPAPAAPAPAPAPAGHEAAFR